MTWMTVSEAAEILGVSQSTIWRRIENGTLPAKYEKGRWWVLREGHDLVEDLLNLLKPVARLDPQKILYDLAVNLAQLKDRHSDVTHVNCKIVDTLNRWPQSYDWEEVNRWYWLSDQVTFCQQAIGQMIQSGYLNADTIQEVCKKIQALRDDWKRYHRNIVEKYHRLNPAIDINPSRQGIAVLNRIMTQLEELKKLF